MTAERSPRSVPDGRGDVDLDTAKYLLYGLSQIEGWGIDAVLAQIFLRLNNFHKQQRIYGNLFEIGVHHGRTAILLALMSSQGEVPVFVDLFDRQEENFDHSGRGNREIFEANLAKWAPGKTAKILTDNSLSLEFGSIAELRDGVRFAHIDGAHYREVVLSDIRKTQEILIEGGIVIVDDYFHSGFPGVNEACNAYLEAGSPERLVPVAMGRNKLILTTPKSAKTLVAHLEAVEVGARHVAFHGHDVMCLDQH
jgi:hypothetical protein